MIRQASPKTERNRKEFPCIIFAIDKNTYFDWKLKNQTNRDVKNFKKKSNNKWKIYLYDIYKPLHLKIYEDFFFTATTWKIHTTFAAYFPIV